MARLSEWAMKKEIAWLLIALVASVAQLIDTDAKEPTPSVNVPSGVPNESDLQEHGHYTNKSGNIVHSPAHSKSGAVPAGASAQCRDGSFSFSQSRRGTCSHHGGVAQ